MIAKSILRLFFRFETFDQISKTATLTPFGNTVPPPILKYTLPLSESKGNDYANHITTASPLPSDF